MNMHFVRLHNLGLTLLNVDANGMWIQTLFIAACGKEETPPHEERGHSLRPWAIESVKFTDVESSWPNFVL